MSTALLRAIRLFLATVTCCFSCMPWCRGAEPETAIKVCRAESLFAALDPFYKQHVVADGLLVVGSEKVSKYALREVAYLACKVLVN